jgi:hypothetical protein
MTGFTRGFMESGFDRRVELKSKILVEIDKYKQKNIPLDLPYKDLDMETDERLEEILAGLENGDYIAGNSN